MSTMPLNSELPKANPRWKAGTAREIITPEPGLWMAGFAIRSTPAESTLTELWVKVLALEDADGQRAVILTSDLLGFPQNMYERLCAALQKQYSLNPAQIMLSASHTHSGPVLRKALYDIYPLDEQQRSLIELYSADLEQRIVGVVGRALAALAPATLWAGQGLADFSVNRRNNLEPEVPRLISEGALKGPVDHAVPVLAVCLPEGTLKAVLFGYACHNTVLSINQWSGDYSGFAQLALEKLYPGAQAMFFAGCAGDQNALPRGEVRLAERYGQVLATAVEKVLRSPLRELPAKLVTKMEMVSLRLGAPLGEDELITLAEDPADPTRRWAGRLLAERRAGVPQIRDYSLPMQAWLMGGEQLFLTLGGEPVVDYALRFKQEFGAQTWVAGFCNEVMNYVPSLRILREDIPPLASARWGYEGSYAFTVYGMPARRWAEDIEDRVLEAARRLVREVGSGGI